MLSWSNDGDDPWNTKARLLTDLPSLASSLLPRGTPVPFPVWDRCCDTAIPNGEHFWGSLGIFLKRKMSGGSSARGPELRGRDHLRELTDGAGVVPRRVFGSCSL